MGKHEKYRSLGVNAVLNGIRTGLSIIFPLITYPYANRILHATGIGKVNFASSIVSYFTLLAGLGISSYAVREGAKVREDNRKFNKFANQMFTINMMSTALSYFVLFICIFTVPKFKDYQLLIIISSLTIIFKTLSVDWINTVYEDFVFITLRTMLAELVVLVLLFLTVKSSNDYIKYAFLGICADFAICVSNIVYCRRYAHIHLTRNVNLQKHIRPMLILFANSVATTIYVNSDTTMLGWMVGDYSVGLYSVAVKVYTVIKNMVAAMYSVAIPRISYYAGQGDNVSIRKIYTQVFSRTLEILIPASAGLFCVSREIVLFMGGQEYIAAISTLQILSISLVGAILGGLITYCLNIPLRREKINMEATILSACLNIGLNIFFIPMFRQNGAALTTLISEFFVFLFCIFRNKDKGNYIETRMILKSILSAAGGVAIIASLSLIAHFFFKSTLEILTVTILGSVIGYFIELLLLKDEIALDIVERIKRKK